MDEVVKQLQMLVLQHAKELEALKDIEKAIHVLHSDMTAFFPEPEEDPVFEAIGVIGDQDA